MRWRDRLQELRELGLGGSTFRIGWEVALRSGIAAHMPAPAPPPPRLAIDWAKVPLSRPEDVADLLRGHVHEDLTRVARDAMRGRILCFGCWQADFGDPIQWHRNPWTGAEWDPDKHWSAALGDESRCGDVKLVWEVARFPHAYHMARAALFSPDMRADLAAALKSQILGFIASNPVGRGVHWASGQEVAFRLMAWIFAGHILFRDDPDIASVIARALYAGAAHIERHILYARFAVHNNHLLSEALLLFIAGSLLPADARCRRWRLRGIAIFREACAGQVDGDGSYIQQSHTYHRVALQTMLWAHALCHRQDIGCDEVDAAMARSLRFLLAHQNPDDGRLPNFGNNDGALPSPLSSCDFADFRPVLQAVSVAVRQQRCYPPGPWDEEALWFCGREALAAAPVVASRRHSVSFAHAGYHVLRGGEESTFCAFRCGTVRDRFSQIDMLHLDVWWRGACVLGDAGSYLYNGPPIWHQHFFRTASHNTVTVDGHDQMRHVRRFKRLYPTPAQLTEFRDSADLGVMLGEHTGFARLIPHCIHRRSILFAKQAETWVVIDCVTGTGLHTVRLHWLAEDPPSHRVADSHQVKLDTADGPFYVAVLDASGNGVPLSVIAGQADPPRGWVSRSYGEKRPAASIAAEQTGPLPAIMMSVLSPGPLAPVVQDDRWHLAFSNGTSLSFAIHQGFATGVQLS